MNLKRDNEGRSTEGGQVQEESKRGTHGGNRLMYILGKAAPDQVLKVIEQKSNHPVARVCRSHGGRQGYQRIPTAYRYTTVGDVAKIQLMRVDKVARRQLAPSHS